MLRGLILAAADSESVRRFVTAYGMRLGAGRFVGGETADEFLQVARRANADGFAVAAGILGEGTKNAADARDAAEQYVSLLQRFSRDGIDANVALKVTHLGLDIDFALALSNLRAVLEQATACGNTMRLDMEKSAYVDATLSMYRAMRTAGYSNIGFVLQSYLFRSRDDLKSLLPLGTNVRIVKGAYLESPSVAFAAKADVDRNYQVLVERSLLDGAYTAIATHDPALIQAAIDFINNRGIPRERFEFQMLYGVSSRLAQTLVAEGYRVRLAVPFGPYWFPYLMRRLAERPANLTFFLKNLLGRQVA
ncbi:MAG: proline dehydrogenase family protein [Candidatus Baltobacteraceae bacterium]